MRWAGMDQRERKREETGSSLGIHDGGGQRLGEGLLKIGAIVTCTSRDFPQACFKYDCDVYMHFVVVDKYMHHCIFPSVIPIFCFD